MGKYTQINKTEQNTYAKFVINQSELEIFDKRQREYCIPKKDDGCRYECHCSNDNECITGVCSNGCQPAALGYNWSGLACQIGNVGLHKTAHTTDGYGYNKEYPPAAALDGRLAGNGLNKSCAHPSNSETLPAEWWADLGDVYRIYNITIYGRRDYDNYLICSGYEYELIKTKVLHKVHKVTSWFESNHIDDCFVFGKGCEERLQQFNLTIYNTSENEVLCAYRHNIINTHATITCNKPVVGRHIHFKRLGGPEINYAGLCEVVIIGHKVYECGQGSYGTNCNQRCGKCKNTCDKVNGQCINGCQLWWADDKCFTYI
ncbi:hypothetical protein LSH36_1692g00013, partial [Paralvinella palmiformis]